KELGKLPNKIAIEGHTDAKAYSANSNYTHWELSADRANAARRMMQENGLGESQVSQVRGFADQRLRKPDAPLDPANRRVSLIVQYMERPVGAPAVAGTAAGGAMPVAKAPDGKAPEGKPADAKTAGEKTPAAKAP
ncbi:MAG: OmpA family protein, partial [Candidatus Acidiferrales bacterium]